MNASIVDRYIVELKRHFRADSDDALSRELNIGKSTLATWRRRGAIPNDFYGELLHSHRIDYFAIVQQHIAEALANSPAGEKLLLSAAMLLGRELDPASVKDWANWIADNRTRIFREIVRLDAPQRTDEVVEDQYVTARMVGLAMRTASDDVLSASQLRAIRQMLHQEDSS